MAELIPGLGTFVTRELASLGARVSGGPSHELRFSYGGPWPRLLGVRTAVAIHAVIANGLRRPSMLLDDRIFNRLLAAIGHIRALHPSGAFKSFRLSAAGADSPTFSRFRERLGAATGLGDVADGGDLLLRFRRAPVASLAQPADAPARGVRGGRRAAEELPGFELLARLSPRPLATRAWRVCNLPGALNATVASAMAALTLPTAEDVYLNLAAGSGTLLIERAALGPARRLIGCDIDPVVLGCAADNLAAAGITAELHPWDAGAVPLPDGAVSAVVADLPYGQLMGSHAANERDYPRMLAEAARLLRSSGRFVAITQQVNLFERCLRDAAQAWSVLEALRLQVPANAGTLRPRVYVLERVTAAPL